MTERRRETKKTRRRAKVSCEPASARNQSANPARQRAPTPKTRALGKAKRSVSFLGGLAVSFGRFLCSAFVFFLAVALLSPSCSPRLLVSVWALCVRSSFLLGWLWFFLALAEVSLFSFLVTATLFQVSLVNAVGLLRYSGIYCLLLMLRSLPRSSSANSHLTVIFCVSIVVTSCVRDIPFFLCLRCSSEVAFCRMRTTTATTTAPMMSPTIISKTAPTTTSACAEGAGSEGSKGMIVDSIKPLKIVLSSPILTVIGLVE